MTVIAWGVDDAPRSRLSRIGAAGCSSAELLALLIGAPAPRPGSNGSLALATSTLEALGGLPGLAAATHDELCSVSGIGPARAAAIEAALELGRRAAAAWPAGRWRVRTPADVALRLVPEMGRLEREELRVVLLNTKNVVVSCTTVYVGNLAGSLVRVGEVFRDAVRRNAAALMVVHNHPSGDPTPSAEDLRITRELSEAGRLLDIGLLDHVIIGQDRWVSLRAMGVMTA